MFHVELSVDMLDQLRAQMIDPGVDQWEIVSCQDWTLQVVAADKATTVTVFVQRQLDGFLSAVIVRRVPGMSLVVTQHLYGRADIEDQLENISTLLQL